MISINSALLIIYIRSFLYYVPYVTLAVMTFPAIVESTDYAIAGVLAMDPAILILDEASAMLDPRGRAGLMRVCRELYEAGMTIVMITHFMEEAAQAQRVVVLDSGCVRLDGTPGEVLSQAAVLAELNLDVPFACRLSLELQSRGIPVATCITESEIEEELCRLNSIR